MHLQKVEAYSKECKPADGRQELNQLKLSGLTLTETLHAPSSSMPLHVHEAASICLTLTGQVSSSLTVFGSSPNPVV